MQISDTFPHSHVLCTLLTKQMSKLATNTCNANCEIFARYAEIDSTDALINNQFFTCFTTRAKIKIRDFMDQITFHFVKLHM